MTFPPSFSILPENRDFMYMGEFAFRKPVLDPEKYAEFSRSLPAVASAQAGPFFKSACLTARLRTGNHVVLGK